MKVDKNAQLVAQFVSKIQNLTRIAELADAFVDIAESGAWRDYTFATGHFRFRLSEFDYFLIATGVKRDDAARVLAYNKRSKELVPFMDPHADKRRRRAAVCRLGQHRFSESPRPTSPRRRSESSRDGRDLRLGVT